MPTPPRTSIEAITAAGREILDTQGLQALTMQAVALAVGVKAPSLYKRVADREHLVGLVADAAAFELSAHLTAHLTAHTTAQQAGTGSLPPSPAHDGAIGALARALRTWARAHPEAYRLVFSGRGSTDAAAATSGPVLAVARSLAGDRDALDAARLITAWATGFISMELAGAFQLDGDVDAAFVYALDRLNSALALPPAVAIG